MDSFLRLESNQNMGFDREKVTGFRLNQVNVVFMFESKQRRNKTGTWFPRFLQRLQLLASNLG